MTKDRSVRKVLVCDYKLGEDRFGDAIHRRMYATFTPHGRKVSLDTVARYEESPGKWRWGGFPYNSTEIRGKRGIWECVRSQFLKALNEDEEIERCDRIEFVRCHRSCRKILTDWIGHNDTRISGWSKFKPEQ